MAKLLILQHVAHEILGTLDPLLRSFGVRMRYVNYEREPGATPTLRGYNGLVVLGGPMNVDQVDRHPHLPREVSLIREAIEEDLPVLGICLGSQLIARALGANVLPSPEKEIGWYDIAPTQAGSLDPVLGGLRQAEKVFQWHGDTFELPEGAVLLATAPGCTNQAFRYGSRVYGLQFHMEVDAPTIERWLTVPANQQEIEATNGAICAERIRRETPAHIERLAKLSDASFSAFVGLLGDRRRRGQQPHR